MFVSRTALRRSASGAGLMDKARDIAFVNADLLGLLRAVRRDLSVERRKMPRTHRILLRLSQNPRDGFKGIVLAGRGFGNDGNHTACALNLKFLAALKPRALQSGRRNHERG